MSATETDRIEKDVLLRAPRSRVWQALADAEQFGQWFGMVVQGRFAPGASVRCAIVGGPYDGFSAPLVVDRIEPEVLFSFRWHPYAVDRDTDYSAEPMTLVTFELADAPEGTRLRIVESGAGVRRPRGRDAPPDRRPPLVTRAVVDQSPHRGHRRDPPGDHEASARTRRRGARNGGEIG